MNVHNVDGLPGAGGQHIPPGSAPAIPSSEDIRSEEIGLQLERILASPSFRNSKRSTRFLRFVVENALAGNIVAIKERLVGIEVFDRPPDYDLAADPIVRGAAGELRKRIATYYADRSHAAELRVELPLGAYVPVFYRASPANKEQEDVAALEAIASSTEDATATADHFDRDLQTETKPRWPWRVRAIVAACLIVLAALGAVFAAHYIKNQSAKRSLDAFWAPLMKENDSIIVCPGDLNHFLKAPPIPNDSWQHFTMTRNHLDPNVGASLLQIGRILGSRGKRAELRLADLTELSDLRQQPVIFVGGFNNPWTRRILADLRFRMFSPEDGSYGMITDQKNPAERIWKIDFYAPVNSITYDYSLITRMDDPLTGQPVLLLSGVGSYGNSAASEFVSDPDYFAQFSRSAPKGWENRTIQIVLQTRVVDGRLSVPRVVAEQVY